VRLRRIFPGFGFRNEYPFLFSEVYGTSTIEKFTRVKILLGFGGRQIIRPPLILGVIEATPECSL
jgi:hypothetical protein